MTIKRLFALLLGDADFTKDVKRLYICCVVLWILASTCRGQYASCQNPDGSFTACTPTPMTVTKVAKVTITVEPQNKTCGLKGVEYYFRLGKKTETLTCDASKENQKHPPAFMIDSERDKTWWQSVTWTIPDYNRNRDAFPVNITLSLNKMFRLTENVTITFNSGRPQKMILLKSVDYGKTWSVLQYYARDCKDFPHAPTKYSLTSPAAVICSERYSQDRSTPSPGGNVFFAGSSERLKEVKRSQYYEMLEKYDLKSFTRFTDIRLMLLYPATDSKEIFTQKSALDFYQYYYAISDIKVIASCSCHQHARSCVLKDQQLVCVCSHNTAGKDCEKCLPLFNDRPWRPGNFTVYPKGQANECIKCECNSHAESCTYNKTYGRGVCNNCTHNTTGNHCQKCVDKFYRNTSLPLSHPKICISCGCEPVGITDDGKCQQEAGNSLKSLGQCNCKPLVTKRRCDSCVDQYYGLLTSGNCTACQCNTDGTKARSNVCNQTTGQCPCKMSTTGQRCDTCKEGFYQFPTGRPDKECKDCGCDPGGSKTAICDNTYGACTCRNHVTGAKCDFVEPGFYVPSLDQLVLQPVGGSCKITGDLWTDASPFDGNVFAVCPAAASGSSVDFQFTSGGNKQLHFVWPHYIGVRYSLTGTTDLAVNQLEVTVDGNSGAQLTGLVDEKGQSVGTTCPESTKLVATIQIVFKPGLSLGWVSRQKTVNLDLRCRYKFKLRLQGQPGNKENIKIDSVVLVPALSYSAAKKSFAEYKQSRNTTLLKQKYITCVQKLTSLLSRNYALETEPCKSLLQSVGAELHNGGQACNCDVLGSIPNTKCHTNGGQCQCKPGVAGRRCERCRAGYFNFTSSGCQPCNCNTKGSRNGFCDVKTGQCECRQNVAVIGQNNTKGVTNDKQCGACLANFYGFGGAQGCVPCECNLAGSNSPQCGASGQCPCKDTIGGRQCSQCKPNFYLFSQNGCLPCNCSKSGSTETGCDQAKGICKCKSNVLEGGKCDKCKPGFYNLADYNPRGCQPCFCFEHGTECKSALGFQEKKITAPVTNTWTTKDEFVIASKEFAGDFHSSYGQLLSFKLGKNGVQVQLASKVLATLEGNGTKLLYYGNQTTDDTADVFVEVRLFPELWIAEATGKQPSSVVMYRVLASLERLSFRKSMLNKGLTLSEVSLVTAKLGLSGPAVKFVEDCTCKPDHFVAGTSCQNCTGGHMRRDMKSLSPYDICVACSCNGRSTECNENLGTCLNCRNGTMGDHCEKCSAHVIAPSCTTCEDGYYGLGANGCKACNCSSIGSTNKVCNKASGQCQCANHVVGRICDVCEDNYYNLKKDVGCVVCSGCYNLVGKEVTKLELLRKNLTTAITTLETSDNTKGLDPFKTRVYAAKLAMDQLLNFLKTAETSEGKVRTQLSGFNSTIKYLRTVTNTLDTVNKAKITSALKEAESNLQKAVDAKNQIKTNMMEINKQIAPLEVIATSLKNLVISLQKVEAYLQGISNSASTGLQDVLKKVAAIEATTAAANRLAENLLQVVKSMLTQHDKNGRDITALEGTSSTLTSLGLTANDEAKRVHLKSNKTLATATSLLTTLQSLGTSNVDFNNLNNQLKFLKTRAESVKNQSISGTSELRAKQQKILQASSLAEQQRINIVNMVTTGDNLEKRAVTASRKAADAKRNSDTVFTSAQNMLETMKNFDTRAKEVEKKATEALKTVQSVNALSQQVIKEANSLITSLSTTQQSSSQAKEIARQAKAVAQLHNSNLKSLANESQILSASLDKEFTAVYIKSGRPHEVNVSIIIPAQTLCDSLGKGITEAKNKTAAAKNATSLATSSVTSITVQASNILNDLRNLGNVDTARITKLQQQVSETSKLFNAQTLAATVNLLKQEINSQKQWLTETKGKLETYKQEIARLKSVQRLIIP